MTGTEEQAKQYHEEVISKIQNLMHSMVQFLLDINGMPLPAKEIEEWKILKKLINECLDPVWNKPNCLKKKGIFQTIGNLRGDYVLEDIKELALKHTRVKKNMMGGWWWGEMVGGKENKISKMLYCWNWSWVKGTWVHYTIFPLVSVWKLA